MTSPDPRERPHTPAGLPVKTRRCPSCGRDPAVVFAVLKPADGKPAPRLVCLACCPRAPGHS